MKYAIFDAVCDGPVPIERDGEDRVVLYDSQQAAEAELANIWISRLEEVVDGERRLDEAVGTEFVLCVEIQNGKLVDPVGRVFSQKGERLEQLEEG